jgi:hypothetical protein
MNTASPVQEAALTRLGKWYGRATEPGLAPQLHTGSFASIQAQLTHSTGPRWLFAAAGFAVACALSMWLLWQPPLSYHLVNATLTQSGYLQLARGAKKSELVFSDGSRVTLSASSRGRIARVTRHGAELSLESGLLSASIVPRDDAKWSITAGPFTVEVTGTRFDVDWSPTTEQLDVRLYEGSLLVGGPLLPRQVGLRAGQQLTASVSGARLVVDELGRAPTPAASAPAPVPPPSSHVGTAAPLQPQALPAPSRPDAPAAAAQSWSELVARGDFRAVVADADARGIEQALSTASRADLMALGDAARYVGRAELAVRAYSAVRTRHAGSADARSAAFFLGRVAEDQQRDYVAALRWYDAYGGESPRGALAAEALGRKMILVAKVSGTRAAAEIARDYLKRFPAGTYAARARELAASR